MRHLARAAQPYADQALPAALHVVARRELWHNLWGLLEGVEYATKLIRHLKTSQTCCHRIFAWHHASRVEEVGQAADKDPKGAELARANEAPVVQACGPFLDEPLDAFALPPLPHGFSDGKPDEEHRLLIAQAKAD